MIEEVLRAKTFLENGGVILYPTDTIWGIGCDATNPLAVEKIYRIKQRSDTKSMLVLMDGTSMLEEYLDTIPEKAFEILGKTGTMVIVRIMGLLLAAIAVQFVITGVEEAITGII